MAFKHSTDKLFTTKYGEPYLWGSGDVTTTTSNENKITASDGATSDSFGSSVAIGSGRIVVGAYGDDTSQGSAYIFDLDGTQLAKITASDGAAGDQFGWSVAIGNGRIVVGAKGDDDNGNSSGSAYIFNLSGTQLAKITASDGAAFDFFGSSVAVGNGRIVVGTIDRYYNNGTNGAIYIYDLNGTQLAKITASDGAANDAFGDRIAIGNGRIVVGALNDDDNGTSSGSAYIFDLDGTQLAKITASDGTDYDFFGSSVAVGNGRIVVGAIGDDDNGSASGSAYIFDLDGTQLAKITASDGATNLNFGHSVSIVNGRIVVGENNSISSSQGSVYIFDLDGNQLEKITASDGVIADFFGFSVAIGNGRIVVGAKGVNSSQGAAYIYNTPRVYTPYDLIYNEV